MLENLISALQEEARTKAEKIADRRDDAERSIFHLLLANVGNPALDADDEKTCRKLMATADISPAKLAEMAVTVETLLTSEPIAKALAAREEIYSAALEDVSKYESDTERHVTNEKSRLKTDTLRGRAGAGECASRLSAIESYPNARREGLAQLNADADLAKRLVEESRAAVTTVRTILANFPNLDAAHQPAVVTEPQPA
jgi:hypothetical protein